MKTMKSMLKIISTVTLTSIATNTIVACDYNSPKANNLNCKYATLLGWYKEENTTSLIQQKLSYDNEKYSVVAESSLITVPNLFKNKLLIQGSTSKTFKAKNENAATFLQELGYTSGNEYQDYSTYDVDKLVLLTAIVKSTNSGKIEENGENDFQIGDGSCQIDIISKNKDFNKVIQSYTINTNKNNKLDINSIISPIIVNKTGLKLTTKQGFKQNKPTNNFKLKLTKSNNQKQFDALVKLLNANISIEFFTDPNNDTSKIDIFSNVEVYLEIHFDNVKTFRIYCGKAPIE